MKMSMQVLVDFLNHGLLPFVGRSNEVGRLLRFWRSTIDARGLRAVTMLGEAGAGKSRLVEELMPRIAEAGGAVAHVKFYPESSAHLPGLVAEALWRSVAARAVLKHEPAPELPAVAGALRRLARLRAILVVIEDIHLLHGDALAELSSLLSILADEPISILCVARPVELAVRGTIEPFIVEELELKGLGAGDLDGIWRELFASVPDGDVSALLMNATRGNPLALRSALRGAVSAGALAQDQVSGHWIVAAAVLAPMLERNLELLVAGMAAHLSSAERAAAGALAGLGEVFARETAAAMLDDPDRVLGALVFKGIIVTASTASAPLPGAASDRPLLAFTHTLVHKYFVEHAAANVGRLVRIIGGGLPLYSILPFDLLARRVPPLQDLPPLEIRGAIGRALQVHRALAGSSGWKFGPECRRAAAALLVSRIGQWSDTEWSELITEMHGLIPNPAAAIVSHGGPAVQEAVRHEECAAPRDISPIMLSMLGTIAVEGAGIERQEVRGCRLRMLLGLMVANGMQRRPLEREEFWLLAGGVAGDITRSRKTMHQGILRLRDLLGRDAVLTDGDVPRLNPDVVRVDLLDARILLAEALDATRRGGLVRARMALIAALGTIRERTPYPTLYDEFFEASREEFENTLRRAVLEVGEHLLREDDAESAGEILERGLAAIPEDEEIALLLGMALDRQGKRVESARMRLRMQVA